MSDRHQQQTTNESSTTEHSDRALIDRREYLRYTGAVAGGSIVAGHGAGATEGDDGESDRSTTGVPTPTDLQTEYERDPMNVRPTEAPRLSWRFPPERRGFNQETYRIQVATSADSFADDDFVWDSEWTESGRSAAVEYGGEELKPDTTYHWRVRIREADGATSDWSEAATFTTALPDADEYWEGKWIGNVPDEDDGPMTWTNYTFEATLQIKEAAAGPLVRAQDSGMFYLWQIVLKSSPDNDTDSHLLRPHRFEDGDWTILEDGSPTTAGVPIDDAIDDPDGDQHVEIAVSDGEITTWINGEHVDSRTDSILERGTIGFRQFNNEHVSIDEIRVTGPDGDVLYADDFETSASEGFEDGEIDDGRLELDGTGVTLYDVDSPSTSPLLRKEIELTGDVESARAHVVTLGCGEFYVNGERVGDEQLNPAKTEYEERVLYTTYDVEDLLEAGENAVGIWLGRGWFAFDESIGVWMGTDWPPMALLQLNVTYADGSTESVVTDGSWRVADSPIVENQVYDGETYDARAERPGWAEPSFDDGDWDDTVTVEPPSDDVMLAPQRAPPIGITETLEPETITEREDGYLVDFGQNHTGWTELTVRGADAGEEISILHVETLVTSNGDLTRDTETGEPNTVDLRQADATDVYVAAGDDKETYAPRFTYHGFRYALVQGYSGELTADDIRSKAVHTSYDRTGSFACSIDELNRVQENAVWGLRSNAIGYPMDCPQRDERLGWTGDVHQNVNADFFNFGNASRFHEKWIRDHNDNQRPEGYVTDTIPHVAASVAGPADPNWGKTRVIIPWRAYVQTGDERVLEESYAGMRDYVDYWHKQADKHVLGAEHLSYGDWLAFEGERTDPALYNTFAHYQTTDLVARAAAELGHEDDAKRYRNRADAIAAAFDDAFRSQSALHFDGGATRDDSLVLEGGGVTLHNTTEGAGEWTDYAFEAEFTLEQDAAGFVFRAQDANNLYMWQINTVNAPQPLLRPHVRENGSWTTLEEVEIGDVFEGEGATHRIEIEVTGDEIITAIDGTQVDSRIDATHESGTVGFRQNGVERVRIHAAEVTDSDGTTLFADDFTEGGEIAYGSGTQTTYALALYSGAVPAKHEAAVAETLADKIREEDDGKLQTGFIGTRPLIYTLVEHGYEELAFRVVRQPEQPGWVYMVRQGATTMWERWDSDEMVASGMNSFNHRPWTLISEWFYRVLAGINVGEPGFAHVEIAPTVVGDLEWAEAETETVRGTVTSRWERVESPGNAHSRDGLILAVTIPGNATATVKIPTLGGEKVRIREGRKPIWNNGNRTRPNHPGIKDMTREDDMIVVEVGAGEYDFELEQLSI